TGILSRRTLRTILSLACVGRCTDVYVNITCVIQRNRFGIMLILVYQTCHNFLGVIWIGYFVICIELVAKYLRIGGCIEISILYSNARATIVTKATCFIGNSITVLVFQHHYTLVA